jgi:ribosomal protein S18 acetylase RimI-like enzyme
MSSDLQILPFQPCEQAQVKELILNGLVEHWGFLDPTKNEDLDNINTSYQDAIFLVAHMGDRVIGCGALIPHPNRTAEIVRMSVHKSFRRYGIGSKILTALLEAAKNSGISCVTLETTATWKEVINFYLKNGFRVSHEAEGNIYFIYKWVSKE